MQKLIAGLHRFQTHVFSSQRELFQRLAAGQAPDALFITCSDSRILPNLITQTDPGELFILRNAGNIVPPASAGPGGEAATIEFAVAGLGVKDIIICGHSHCGAMQGLLKREELDSSFPVLGRWLDHADATRRLVLENYSHLSGLPLVTATVEENVLVQIENLRTHACVAEALAKGAVTLHGWVYKIETGEVFAYDPEQHAFLPVAEVNRRSEPPPPGKLGVTI
jgi:carbonic anhydrase